MTRASPWMRRASSVSLTGGRSFGRFSSLGVSPDLRDGVITKATQKQYLYIAVSTRRATPRPEVALLSQPADPFLGLVRPERTEALLGSAFWYACASELENLQDPRVNGSPIRAA